MQGKADEEERQTNSFEGRDQGVERGKITIEVET